MQGLGLKEQLAFGLAMPGAVQAQTFSDIGTVRSRQRIKGAASLAGVTGYFGHTLFMTVKFLKYDHRQEDVVFFKTEQAHRVVQQNVGIQHK